MPIPSVWESAQEGADTTRTRGGDPAANEDAHLLRLLDQGTEADTQRGAMVESLPDRPMRIKEVEQIEDAGGYELVKPGAVLTGEASPVGEESTEQIIIVADEWFGAIVREDDGWRMLFRDDRTDADMPLCYIWWLWRN